MLKAFGIWPFGDIGKSDEKKLAASGQTGGGAKD
jgi:hypothetical protein